MRRSRFVAVLLMTCAGVVFAPPAAGEEPTPPSSGSAEGPPAVESAVPIYRPFELDAVLDPALMVFAIGVGGGSQLIIQSGALSVPIPGAIEDLPGIDRDAALNAYQNPIDEDFGNLFLGLTGIVATGSAVASWMRDDWREGLMDLAMYAETLAVNFTVNNLVKVAVRRPRPRAYAAWFEDVVDDDGSWDPNSPEFVAYQRDTEQGLSFYSLHTSTVASLWATASYISFVRDYNPVEKWVVLGVGAAFTASVAGERIASLDHFPTDVLAGGMAGLGVGLLVPHLHRSSNLRVVPAVSTDGGLLTVSGPLDM